jgi:hypothetical protein
MIIYNNWTSQKIIRYTRFNNSTKLIIIANVNLVAAIFLSFHISIASAYSEIPSSIDRENIAEVFDFSSGLFAALLCGLSLIAYKKIKLKRILFVSIAFGLFAIRTIVSEFDLFMPEVESSIIEMTLAIMTFVALSLFFIAIVGKGKSLYKNFLQKLNILSSEN